MRQQMEQNKRQQFEDQMPDPCINTGDGVLRRNNRGCKSKDFYNWPEQPLEDMDSPFYYQQYIQQLIYRNPADLDEILRLPDGQDLGVWKVEHLRIFCMQLNRLAAKLQDCCHPDTCNQMTATEQWIFLCAAHKQPNECSAIDYTRHTLDGAASLLNSNKYFPSRVTVKDNSVAKLGSVCRRVYRIFSHAYYHHFQVFEEFERETHLCKRFSKFVTMYELMPKESLIVPSDGSKPSEQQASANEGDSITTEGDSGNLQQQSKPANMTIIKDDVTSKRIVPVDSSTQPATSTTFSPTVGDENKAIKEPNNNMKSEASTATSDLVETKTAASTPSPEATKSVKRQVLGSVSDQSLKSSGSPSQAHSTNTMVKGSSKIPTTAAAAVGGTEAPPTSRKQTGPTTATASSKSTAS